MKELKKYEHISIFKGDLEDYTKELEKFEKQFNKFKITKIEKLGIKNLAYEIKKNKKGYFIVIEFEGLESNIAKIEKYCRENDNILKFITIRK